MPPRFVYWTILIDGKPTAFRARDREELRPTISQLKRTNQDVVLKWFARGRLWDSPEAERAAESRPKFTGEKRGAGWRPGGQHKDPRDRFKKKNRLERAWSEHESPTRRDPEKLGPPRDRKPWENKPPGPPRGRKPWENKPSGPPRGRKPWENKPPGLPRDRKPWENKPSGPPRDPKPWQNKPSGRPRDPKPWQNKPSGRPHDRKPWQNKTSGDRPPRQGDNRSGAADQRATPPRPRGAWRDNRPGPRQRRDDDPDKS